MLESNTQITKSKLEECNNYIEILENKQLARIKDRLVDLEKTKASKNDLNTKTIEGKIETLDRIADIFDNKIKYLENFIDKYQPIQMQALISDSIYSFAQSDARKRYKIHLSSQMEKFHQKVLDDEGVSNLELSIELLSGLAADTVRRKRGRNSKYPKAKSSSFQENKVEEVKITTQKVSLGSNKAISTLDPEVIMEKSENDSNGQSSIQPTPREDLNLPQENIEILEKSSVNTLSPNLSKSSTIHAGKGFLKKEGQYFIEELKIDTSSKINSVGSNKRNNFIQDMQEVEEVLFDVQNNYMNLEKKIEEQLNFFTSKLENKINSLSKSVEFSNNQMNVYMQMFNQDLESLKK